MRTKKSSKNLEKFTSAFLASVLILSGSVPVLAKHTNWESKISNELLQKMETASDSKLIPIYIFQRNIDQEIVEERLLDEKGYEMQVYEDTDRYETEIKPQIEETIEEQVGYEQAHKSYSTEKIEQMKADITAANANSDELELSENLDLTTSLVEKAVQADRQEYRHAKLQITEDECERLIDTVLAEKEDAGEVLYTGDYTATVILEATKLEIIDYAKNSNVEYIDYYDPLLLTEPASVEMDQVHVTGAGGAQSAGYTGAGMKVGVIEAEKGRLQGDSTQLRDGFESGRIQFIENVRENQTIVESMEAAHATLVTCIVGGSPVIVNDQVYKGVVPNAEIYQMAIDTRADVYSAMGILVNLGVSAINGSFGARTETGYSSYDREVDKIIASTGVVFIAATGNEGKTTANVLSPGKSCNAISVGNLETKDNNTTAYSMPHTHEVDGGIEECYTYPVHQSSSWLESAGIPNKPDVMAPGKNICYVLTGSLSSRVGTSFAAPIVAGIVTQMIQANPYLQGKPSYVKSCLSLSADADIVCPVDNESKNTAGTLSSKSGAGLVNATAAVSVSKSNNWYYGAFNTSLEKTISLKKDQTVRVALAWDRNARTSGTIGSLDLSVMYNGRKIASCKSDANNVEVLEFNVEETDNYSLVVTDNKSNSVNVTNIALTWSYDTNTPFINGYTDGTFKPENSLTRAEAAQMFYKLQPSKERPLTIKNPDISFTDVTDPNEWYYDAVMALATMGIINGDGGLFRPNDNVTRAEFVKMSVTYVGLTEAETPSNFPDCTEHWASKYISKAQELGYVTGYPDGKYYPENPVTRAEAVTLLGRMIGLNFNTADFAGNAMPFSDVDTTYWAWEEIMLAAVEHTVF